MIGVMRGRRVQIHDVLLGSDMLDIGLDLFQELLVGHVSVLLDIRLHVRGSRLHRASLLEMRPLLLLDRLLVLLSIVLRGCHALRGFGPA